MGTSKEMTKEKQTFQILSLEYSMSVKQLTEHHLEFLSLKGGCIGSSESTLVKMPHCWKSHVTAHMDHFRLGNVPSSVLSYRD